MKNSRCTARVSGVFSLVLLSSAVIRWHTLRYTKLLNQLQNIKLSIWYDYNAGATRLKPQDNLISYQSFQQGKYSLFATTLDGSKQWKLTEQSQNDRQAALLSGKQIEISLTVHNCAIRPYELD